MGSSILKKSPRKAKQRLQQNFRECYLNTKKKVSQLQPNHGTQPNFFYAVKNNIQNSTVRRAAKTAGKVMVYVEPFKNNHLKTHIWTLS